MAYLIGVDEAGYGPNLGPLVISVTAWHVPGESTDVELYEQLGGIFTSKRQSGDERIVVADSKMLFQPRGGLLLLARAVLPSLAVATGQTIDRWRTLWPALHADPAGCIDSSPWYTGFDRSLPVDLAAAELPATTNMLTAGLRDGEVTLSAIRSRAVFPKEFNALVEQHDSKGLALSHLTLQLLAQVLAECDAEPTLVICDKHGGRNRYGALLQQEFPESLVEVLQESRPVSRYRWGAAESRTEVRFQTGGESFLPAALASLFCKYLRELAMEALNAYWIDAVPGLKPTAGYPVDAKRFRSEIAEAQRRLEIEDRVLWRRR